MIGAFALSIALAAAAPTPPARTPPAPSPGEISQRIAKEGAKVVVDALYNAKQWDAVIDHIGTGNGGWIALAPKLAKGTDASTSETLTIGLAEALPHNPKGVLAVLDPSEVPLSPERVCSAPFMEGSQVDLPAYKSSTLIALQKVGDARLAPIRNACVVKLGE